MSFSYLPLCLAGTVMPLLYRSSYIYEGLKCKLAVDSCIDVLSKLAANLATNQPVEITFPDKLVPQIIIVTVYYSTYKNQKNRHENGAAVDQKFIFFYFI